MPNGFIHVFGGWMGHERYEISKDEWTTLEDLNNGKSGTCPIPSVDYK